MRASWWVVMLWIMSACAGGEQSGVVDLEGSWTGTWNQPTATPAGNVVMTITSQASAGSDFEVEGFFDWECVPLKDCSGREEFSGSLSVNGTLEVKGFNLVNPIGIGLGRYLGTVSTDGQLVSGMFLMLPPHQGTGSWSVTRNQ